MRKHILVSEQRVIVERFWRYSQQVYAVPTVEALCLSLQNNHQCNVNLLLWLGFCVKQRWMVDLDFLRQQIEDGDQKLSHFRAYRKVVKSLISERQYRLLLIHELKLEQRQQQQLVQSQLNSVAKQPAEQALSEYLEPTGFSSTDYLKQLAQALV